MCRRASNNSNAYLPPVHKEFQTLVTNDVVKCHTYIPSFSNVEALGLLRLLTNVSSLNDDGIVPLQ